MSGRATKGERRFRPINIEQEDVYKELYQLGNYNLIDCSMRLRMAQYRVYCLDESLHIVLRREFDANDDAAAIEIVRTQRPDTSREVWHTRRKVAVIPPDVPAIMGAQESAARDLGE